MRFDHLDLNLLVALDALLTERHVTRAGERLSLTQPAMSGALARLRAHFDDLLLVKIGQKMVLTPLAEKLSEPVRDVLIRTQALLSERPAFDPAFASRRFCIVSSDFINALLMLDLSKEIASQAPNVKVELLEPVAGAFYEDLENGNADLLIVPRSLTTSEHPSEILIQDELVCAVWNENTAVGDRVSLEDYVGMSHVSVNFGRARLEGIEANYLQSIGITRHVTFSVPQFLSLPQLVVGTDRIATVPRRLALLAAKTLPIRIVTPEIDFPPIEEVVQWHTHREHDPGLLWLRDVLAGVAGKCCDG